MADEWRRTTIGGEATLQRGFDITRTDQREGSIPVVSSGGISSYHDTAAVRGPGVVLGPKGIIGSVFYVVEDYWPHDTTLWVRDFHGNDPRFVYYFFKHMASRLSSMDVGSANPTLNRNHVHPIEIVWPCVGEQRAIAHILGTLDDKIELNRRMNETLEAIARAIFKSWFGDFDPVRAKAEGRDPGLPKPLADLFPDSFEDSDLGEIPTGWRVLTVEDIAEINAWTLSRSDPLPVIDYIEISEVMRGEISTIVRYARGEEPSRARRRMRHGDTVLSTVRPDRAAHFLCLHPSETLIASTGFAVLSPLAGDWAYLYAATTRHETGEELGRLADGGAYPAVRPEAVGKLSLVVPNSLDLQVKFQEIVGPLFDRADKNRMESRTLAALRDTLLAKLISGELRVKNAERFIEGRD